MRRFVTLGLPSIRFPTCFVCGLSGFAGMDCGCSRGLLTGREIFAAPWVPDAFARSRRRQECGRSSCGRRWIARGVLLPTNSGRGLWLLGEFTAHVDRLRSCGRALPGGRVAHLLEAAVSTRLGTALFDEDGESLCGRAKRAIWIEPPSAARLLRASESPDLLGQNEAPAQQPNSPPAAPTTDPTRPMRISRARRTPASPPAASPYRVARPSITASAPSASAFATSVPRRNPLSTMMVIFFPTAAAMSGTISNGATQ